MVKRKKTEPWHQAVSVKIPKGASDRDLVIMGTARLEFILADMLLLRLLGKDGELLETVENLSFGQRIKWCVFLGLITEVERKGLEAIREIRNDFAHRVKIDFKSQQDSRFENLDKYFESLEASFGSDRGDGWRKFFDRARKPYKEYPKSKLFRRTLFALAAGVLEIWLIRSLLRTKRISSVDPNEKADFSRHPEWHKYNGKRLEMFA